MIPKFRAWKIEGEYSRMLTTNQAVMTAIKNCYDGVGVAEGTTGYHYVDTTLKPQKYILMQSTGLKDKNGVEIFEGDIGWDDHQEVHGQVIFENGAFKYEWENISEDLFEVTDDVEIVGNIYENSELLEQKEKEC